MCARKALRAFSARKLAAAGSAATQVWVAPMSKPAGYMTAQISDLGSGVHTYVYSL